MSPFAVRSFFDFRPSNWLADQKFPWTSYATIIIGWWALCLRSVLWWCQVQTTHDYFTHEWIVGTSAGVRSGDKWGMRSYRLDAMP